MIERNANMFEPDWTQVWTAEEAERELKGFKFKGPGLYMLPHPGDCMMVIPFGVETDWKARWPKNQKFKFYVYNGRDPSNAFNMIVNAPVKVDER